MKDKLNPVFERLNPTCIFYHAEKDLQETIPKEEIKASELLTRLTKLITNSTKTVFLLSCGDEIIVFDDFWNGERYLKYFIFEMPNQEKFLFEFYSYEEAYAVALDMKEVNPLCYESASNEGGSSSDEK